MDQNAWELVVSQIGIRISAVNYIMLLFSVILSREKTKGSLKAGSMPGHHFGPRLLLCE